MNDDVSYNPIQGQGLGGCKVAKMSDFTVYLLHCYACIQVTNGEL